MKICIYNEPWGGTMGGCEVCVAVLASALADEHEVEIVHYRPQMSRESLADFADVDLRRVKMRLGPRLEPQKGSPWRVAERYRKEKEQESGIGGDCDVFISFNHQFPVFSTAKLQILVVLFPFAGPDSIDPERSLKSAALEWSKEAWRRWKLSSRLRSYQVKLSISEFTRKWTKRRWGVNSEVHFPPVDVNETLLADKENRILSVGRFTVGSVSKKQIEMLNAFGELRRQGASNWHYDCVGACGSAPAELDFLGKAQTLAIKEGAKVSANLDRVEMRRLYRCARIFWHATGMDIDEDLYPELAEHFGMTTVEAMAAGCVPVVIDKGGQSEIVEHGVTGFLWKTVAELERYTKQLMENRSLLEKMSRDAQARSRDFSRDIFVSRFKAILRENNFRHTSSDSRMAAGVVN